LKLFERRLEEFYERASRGTATVKPSDKSVPTADGEQVLPDGLKKTSRDREDRKTTAAKEAVNPMLTERVWERGMGGGGRGGLIRGKLCLRLNLRGSARRWQEQRVGVQRVKQRLWSGVDPFWVLGPE